VHHGDTILVGLGGKDIEAALAATLEPRHAVVDVVGLAARGSKAGRYTGICW
jgi:hypothetical protein